MNAFICKVEVASGPQFEADSNGNAPLYLTPYNGELPKRARVMNGTIAQNLRIVAGRNYAIVVKDLGEQTFANRNGEEVTDTVFGFENFGEISAFELLQLNPANRGQVVKAVVAATAQTSENQANESKEVPV